MALNNLSVSVRNAMVDAFVGDLDGGSTDATADLLVYTAAFGSLLSEHTFAAPPSFGAAAAGVATANAIATDASANATGTAAVLRMQDRDNATVAEGTVGTSGADLNFNTVSFTTGDEVQITSATLTMPAS